MSNIFTLNIKDMDDCKNLIWILTNNGYKVNIKKDNVVTVTIDDMQDEKIRAVCEAAQKCE